MEKILLFLQGKKGMISSVIMTIVAWAAARGLLSDVDVVYIGALSTIIFGGASYATSKILPNNSIK